MVGCRLNKFGIRYRTGRIAFLLPILFCTQEVKGQSKAQFEGAVVASLPGSGGIAEPSSLDPVLWERGGLLIVARHELNSLQMFDSDGAKLSELRSTDSLPLLGRVPMVRSKTSVTVFVGRLRQLVTIRIAASKFAGVIRRFSTTTEYSDICSIGSKLFLYSQDLGGVIDVIGTDGSRIAKKWAAFQPVRSRLQREENAGQLVCDESSKQVVFISAFFGSVNAFGLNGRQQWSSRIAGLSQRTPHLDPGRSYWAEEPPDGYHLLQASRMIGKDRLLVQFAKKQRVLLPWGRSPQIYSIVIDTKSGKTLKATTGWPLILAASKGFLLGFDSHLGSVVEYPLETVNAAN